MSGLKIALLRAVNVGGRKVIMADLRDLLAGMGLEVHLCGDVAL